MARKTDIRLRRSAVSGSIPTTSNLNLGELALNTADGKVYMKKSVGGVDSIVEVGSGAGISASFDAYEYSSSSNQTTFSGTDNNGNTLAYNTGSPSKVQVYMNGILLDEGSSNDYTATNGTSVVLTTAATTGDIIQIHAYKSDINIVNDLTFEDNQKLKLGDDDDLKLYHSGNHSYVQADGTGDLYIENLTQDEDIIMRINDGGSMKTMIFMDGNTALTKFQESTRHKDGKNAGFGDSDDLMLYHNGTNSFIKNATNDLYILNEADDKDIMFQADNGSGGNATYFQLDGSQEQLKVHKNMVFFDNVKAYFGGGADLGIWHDGSNSYIADTGTGNLFIRGENNVVIENNSGSNYFEGTSGGASRLYFAGNERLTTSSVGTDFTGNVTVNVNSASTTFGNHDAALRIDNTNATANNWASLVFDSSNAAGADISAKYTDHTNNYADLYFSNRSSGGYTTKMVILQDGKVGIGTSTPETTLHVQHGTDTSAAVHITGGHTGRRLKIQSFQSGGADGAGFLFNADSSYGAIKFQTTSTDRMIIANDGKVGIKNSSPSSQYFNTLVVGDTSGEHGITIQSSATSRGVLAFSDTNSATAGRYDGYIAYNHNSTYMSFHTNTGNEHMRIDSSGKVGIGTTSPSKKLTVVGGAASNDGAAETVLVTGSQNVRSVIESTSTTGHRATLELRSDGGDKVSIATWGNNHMLFELNNIEKMRLQSDGSLGIGTTSPDAKLEVAGGSTGIILSNAGDSSAYDQVAMTYSGYNSGTPEFIFQPKTAPGSGTVNSYFRFKSNTSGGGGSNVANVSIDGGLSVTGNTTINGNLTVDGTTTTINTANLNVEDKNITLNYGSGDTSASANGAGITIQDAVNSSTDATILWNATTDQFDFSHHIKVPDSKYLKMGNDNDFIIYHDGTSNYIQAVKQDSDIIFRGNDGGTNFNAVTIDMSASGAATFNDQITVGGHINMSSGNDIKSPDNFAIHDTGGSIDRFAFSTNNFFNVREGGYQRFTTRASGASLVETLRLQDNRVQINNSNSIDNNAQLHITGYSSGHAGITMQDVDVTNGKTFIKQSSGATEIQTQNGSSHGIFKITGWNGSAAAEFFRIDASGNVGIGTSNPGTQLEINSDGSYVNGAELLLKHANNNSTDIISTINFANNAGSAAMIQAGTTGANNTGYISFHTDNAGTSSEKMRITADGYLLVGKTDSSFTTNGTEIRGGNLGARVIRQNAEPLTLHRRSSDGAILNLYKDSASVGNIGTYNADLHIGTGNTGIGFNDNGRAIIPMNTSTPAFASALISLGTSSVKFKDIHLSGVANVGGGILHLGTADSSSGHLNAKELMTFNIDTDNDDTNRYFAFYKNGESGSGTELMRLTEDGSLGIGETSPDGKLHIKGGTATGDLSHVLFENTQGSKVFAIGGGASGVTNNNLFFRNVTDNTTPMVITDAGDVGIGTTAPADTLHISGGNILLNNALEIRTKDTGGNIRTIARANSSNELEYGWSANAPVKFMGGGSYTERMRIHTNGNIGIGTTTPASKLSVADSNGAGLEINPQTSNDRVILFAYDRGASTYQTMDFDATDFHFNPNGTEKMRLKSNGFLGIGTSSPLDLLHLKSTTTDARAVIDGHTDFDAELKFAENGTVKYTVGHDAASDNFVIGTTNVDTGQRLVISSSGNVGIGTTSPANKLHVNGTVKAEGAYYSNVTSGGGAAFVITHSGSEQWSMDARNGSSSTDYVDFGIAGGTRCMTWQDDGKVGIGTNAPSAPLEVVGSDSGIKITSAASDRPHLSLVNGTSEMLRLSANNVYAAIGDSSNSQRYMVFKSGNVGINNTNPTAKFDLVDGNNYAQFGDLQGNSTMSLRMADTTTQPVEVQAYGSELRFNTATSSGSTPSVKMNILANGKVGIGNTSPLQLLSVGGIINSDASDDYYGAWLSGNSASGQDNYLGLGPWWNNAGYIKFIQSGSPHRLSIYTHLTGDHLTLQEAGGKVGVGTTSPASKFQVGHGGIDVYAVNTSATSAAQVDTFSASTFRSARFTVQITNTTDDTYQITEILLIHDGTTPAITEYGTIFTGSAREASFDADIVSGNVRLLATPASTDTMQFKVVRHSILV